MLAKCGYGWIKTLQKFGQEIVHESRPAFKASRQSSFSLNGQAIGHSSFPWNSHAHAFRAIGHHAFRAVCHSTHPLKCCTHAFRAVGHSTNPWKQHAHAFRAGGHSTNPFRCHTHAFRAVGHSINPWKWHAYALRAIEDSITLMKWHAHAFRAIMHSEYGMKWHTHLFKQISLPCLRTAWQNLYARPRSSMPLGLIVRAVSLACARSHLPLGITALILGGMNHHIVEAQGNTSLQSSSSSFVSSFLFTLLEFLGLATRSIYLWILLMPAVLTAPFADMFGGRYRQAWLHLVRCTLEYAGAAFIKWGQWAATRPDLFPRDLCSELTKLHANAPAHKFSHTVQTVEQAFGKRLHEIFEDFEEKPVASGSIAQVHKATLRYGGSERLVAVKVRHPGVSDVIRRDFIIINWVANLTTLVPGLRWLRLDESVRQFAVFMLTQVDLAREAAHLSRFLYNFRSWRDVSFPRPVYPLVHPAVLVETYEQGESVSHFIEISEKSRINRKLAHIGTHTFLKMLLVDNFIHADMHPGNILVRVKRKRNPPGKGVLRSRPHVVFLDVGLTAELSQRDRGNLLDFFKAVALRDGRTAAQCALEFSTSQSCPNPAAFVKELESSFKFWGSREADVIHPGECMQELLEQVRKHRVNIDGDVCTVMVTIMVLEGWQRRLDPDYSIMNTLQKLLFKQDWAESLSYTINGIMAP